MTRAIRFHETGGPEVLQYEDVEVGAAHVVATKEQDIFAEVMRMTENTGARMVFDSVAGPQALPFNRRRSFIPRRRKTFDYTVCHER